MSPEGDDEVLAAFGRAGRQARMKFQSKLVMLAQIPFEQWKNGVLYKDLQSTGGLGEIRFTADNVEQRLFGFKSGDYEWTILIWSQKKGRRYDPRDAIERAVNRKNEVLKDGTQTNALWIALE